METENLKCCKYKALSDAEMRKINGGLRTYTVNSYYLVPIDCGPIDAEHCWDRMTNVSTYRRRLFGQDEYLGTETVHDGIVGSS